MAAIYPISSSRVSDLLLRERLTSQFESDRAELLVLQDQISSGIRVSKPSDDAPASLRAIALQGLLEQKQQAKTNLNTSQSFVAAADDALSSVSGQLAEIRAQALTVVDSTTSQSQRDIMVRELQQTIDNLLNTGNRKFRGRYLFAGSTTAIRPFREVRGHVVYEGNEQSLQSLVDIDFLAATNVTGDAVFGAISSEVRGINDLNPVLTPTTRLSSLHGGLGISLGSFVVSDGNSSQTVDVSSAETIEDVIRLIETNPPSGRNVVVRLSGNGLIVDLDDEGGGNLTIRGTPEGTTASELGIREEAGVGVAPLYGGDVNPRLQLTTPLADLLGTRASAVLVSPNNNADILLEAGDNGAEFNDVTVQFVAASAAGDQALVTYDETTKVLEIDISPGNTTANTVVTAVNASGIFVARLDDKRSAPNDGTGAVALSTSATTSGGSGIVLDQTSGIQIVNGNATHTITFEEAETVEDLLNSINQSGAHTLAQINQAGDGIDIRSRLSGSDFQIGESGGTTASELGIRTLTLATKLAELNFGRGVDVAAGSDFVIQRKDGVPLAIDISAAQTVEDVIEQINTHPDNVGDPVVARLAEFGNGIEIFDENETGPQTVTVTRAQSFAARDLGILGRDSDSDEATAAQAATANLSFSTKNTSLTLTAAEVGFGRNGVEIVLADTRTGDVADASFDALANRLTINIDASQTTANTVVSAVSSEGTFTAALNTEVDVSNDGSGVISASGSVATTAGGAAERLVGRDVHPRETKGVFNSLIRLREAVQEFDLVEISRAAAMLDDDFDTVNFARAELGARGRSLDAVERRIEGEEVEMRAALSEEIDTDVVKAISDLTGRQAALQATLQLIGRVLRLTVLDFL